MASPIGSLGATGARRLALFPTGAAPFDRVPCSKQTMMTLLHVICGTFVLVVAPAALVVRKGGRWHRRWGTAFMLAMSVVLFTAGFMWQPKGHIFLFALALVSGYLVFNGYRILARRRRPRADALDDGIDVAAAGMTVVAGLWLIAIAASAGTDLMRSLAPIMAGLGVVAIAFALNDVRGVFGPRSRVGPLIAHFSAMIAAYISAVTAFIVINAHGVPMELRWLVPIGIGTLVITGYSLPYRIPKTVRAKVRARFTGIRRVPVTDGPLEPRPTARVEPTSTPSS
jgi:hypothetical protein